MTRFMLQRWSTERGYWETLHDLPELVDAEMYLNAWGSAGNYRILEYREIVNLYK